MSKITHNQNGTNWVMQGPNGQSQMVKLVQQGKSNIVSSSVSGPIKLLKSANLVHSQQGLISNNQTNQQQTIRTITTPNSKIVTKPVTPHVSECACVSNITKGPKTIRVTQAQLQNFMPNTSTRILSSHHGLTSQAIPVIQQTPPTTTTTNYYQQHQPVVKNNSPPILSRKRPNLTDNIEFSTDNKRVRKSEERISRGLRHFSMKVCEKVKEKITTTYNEVADDLVREFTTQQGSNGPLADQYDQKNIRRRVYDALNVLMAMNIISKEKKEIRWIGLPTNSAQECQELQKEVQKKIANIKEKEKQFRELIINQIAFKSLAQRNKETEALYGPPDPNSFIQLPFIVINTLKKTVINCSISNDKTEYLLQFNDKFEINDDLEILKQIGMLHGLDTGKCSREDLQKIKSLLPESLWPYVEKLAAGAKDPLQEFLNNADPCSSTMTQIADFVETRLDEINSRPSSSIDPLSPNRVSIEYSDDELDSDLSSDELN